MATPIPLTVDESGPAGAIPVSISGIDVSDKTQIAALTAIGTADATDAASTQALANAIKAKVNQIIAALKA